MTDVEKLEGAELDHAVGKAAGLNCVLEAWMTNPVRQAACWICDENGRISTASFMAGPYNPSTDWGKGGPLIERAAISLYPNYIRDGSGRFDDWIGAAKGSKGGTCHAVGATPLIAAMRCFVLSKA